MILLVLGIIQPLFVLQRRVVKTGPFLTGDVYNKGATAEELQAFGLGDPVTGTPPQPKVIVPEGSPYSHTPSATTYVVEPPSQAYPIGIKGTVIITRHN
jgi:hypothetical protein